MEANVVPVIYTNRAFSLPAHAFMYVKPCGARVYAVVTVVLRAADRPREVPRRFQRHAKAYKDCRDGAVTVIKMSWSFPY
jgi:hypothetical protein